MMEKRIINIWVKHKISQRNFYVANKNQVSHSPSGVIAGYFSQYMRCGVRSWQWRSPEEIKLLLLLNYYEAVFNYTNEKSFLTRISNYEAGMCLCMFVYQFTFRIHHLVCILTPVYTYRCIIYIYKYIHTNNASLVL